VNVAEKAVEELLLYKELPVTTVVPE